jgi:hypothetical protein
MKHDPITDPTHCCADEHLEHIASQILDILRVKGDQVNSLVNNASTRSRTARFSVKWSKDKDSESVPKIDVQFGITAESIKDRRSVRWEDPAQAKLPLDAEPPEPRAESKPKKKTAKKKAATKKAKGS